VNAVGRDRLDSTVSGAHHDFEETASAPSGRTTVGVDASRGVATPVAVAGAPVMAASLGLRERRRLERDLHDGAQQRLVSLALTLRLARGIHPAVLADRGLGAAVEELAARAPLPVKVVCTLPDQRLPERV
jgi:signal transduction histidine kinase